MVLSAMLTTVPSRNVIPDPRAAAATIARPCVVPSRTAVEPAVEPVGSFIRRRYASVARAEYPGGERHDGDRPVSGVLLAERRRAPPHREREEHHRPDRAPEGVGGVEVAGEGVAYGVDNPAERHEVADPLEPGC